MDPTRSPLAHRRSLRRNELKLLPEGERELQVVQFANYAVKVMMLQLALSCRTPDREDLLFAAESFALRRQVGVLPEDQAEYEGPYTLVEPLPQLAAIKKMHETATRTNRIQSDSK
jgi:hypothetical protein